MCLNYESVLSIAGLCAMNSKERRTGVSVKLRVGLGDATMLANRMFCKGQIFDICAVKHNWSHRYEEPEMCG